MAFDYNTAASKYFIDRLADHHVEAVTNEKTNKNGAIAVTIEFKTDADGKITYNEPKVLHKYNLSEGDAGYDASKKDNLYEDYTCNTLYGTWANPSVGGSTTINGKEHICKSILDPSAVYEVFKLKNFGEFILHKELDGGLDTDAVAIDNASDEKDDEKVMTARAIEKSLAWENVNGKTGSIVSYIKNGEDGSTLAQPTVTGDYSLAFGESGDDAASTDGDYAIAFNGYAIGDSSISINGAADGTSDDIGEAAGAIAINAGAIGYNAVAINGEAEGDGAVAINGEAEGKAAIAIGATEATEDEVKPSKATEEGAVAIRGNASGKDSLAINLGKAKGELSIAFGKYVEEDTADLKPSVANDDKGIAINAKVSGEKAIGINSDYVAGENAIGIGGDGSIGEKAVAINGFAKGKQAIAINGQAAGDSYAAVDYAIAIGGEIVYDPGTPDEWKVPNQVKNVGSIAIGAGARADGMSNNLDGGAAAIAIGQEAFAEGSSIAIGKYAEANYVEWTDPDDPSWVEEIGSVAIGASSSGASVAIGSSAGKYGVSVGFKNNCSENGVAVGHAISTNWHSIAIGNDLRTERHHQAVIGTKNNGEAYGEEWEVPAGWVTPIFTIANGDNVWTKEEKPDNPDAYPDFSRPETDPNDPDYEYNAENSNALDLMANGDLYLMGIGGYNGQNLARQDVVMADLDHMVIDPLTNRPIKLVQPLQDVIFTMQKKIEYLEGIIEHITEIINN